MKKKISRNQKKSVTTKIRTQYTSIETSPYPNSHTTDASAGIPSSAYIHIEKYITRYKSVLQFEILNIPKRHRSRVKQIRLMSYYCYLISACKQRRIGKPTYGCRGTHCKQTFHISNFYKWFRPAICVVQAKCDWCKILHIMQYNATIAH